MYHQHHHAMMRTAYSPYTPVVAPQRQPSKATHLPGMQCAPTHHQQILIREMSSNYDLWNSSRPSTPVRHTYPRSRQDTPAAHHQYAEHFASSGQQLQQHSADVPFQDSAASRPPHAPANVCFYSSPPVQRPREHERPRVVTGLRQRGSSAEHHRSDARAIPPIPPIPADWHKRFNLSERDGRMIRSQPQLRLQPCPQTQVPATTPSTSIAPVHPSGYGSTQCAHVSQQSPLRVLGGVTATANIRDVDLMPSPPPSPPLSGSCDARAITPLCISRKPLRVAPSELSTVPEPLKLRKRVHTPLPLSPPGPPPDKPLPALPPSPPASRCSKSSKSEANDDQHTSLLLSRAGSPRDDQPPSLFPKTPMSGPSRPELADHSSEQEREQMPRSFWEEDSDDEGTLNDNKAVVKRWVEAMQRGSWDRKVKGETRIEAKVRGEDTKRSRNGSSGTISVVTKRLARDKSRALGALMCVG